MHEKQEYAKRWKPSNLGDKNAKLQKERPHTRTKNIETHRSAVRTHDLARLGGNRKFSAVQMVDRKRVPAERFLQGQVFVDEQIVVFALEHRVVFLLEQKHNVAGFAVGLLVAHASEPNLFPVFHAPVNVYLQHLPLLLLLAAGAGGAAGGALLLQLLHHARADLPQFYGHAFAVAVPAGFGGAYNFVPGHR